MIQLYREDLQIALEGFQAMVGETPHVYYQPPESVKLVYPCFVYSFDNVEVLYSNGKPYLQFDRYTVTYITKNPSPILVKSMMRLPAFSYERHFTSENLHHYSFVVASKMYAFEDTVDLSETASSFLGGTTHGKA